jgi:uncharacterized membrane protein YhaH (DUF805 family)
LWAAKHERNVVENIDWGWLLFKFDGRINRAKFWIGIVILWAANAILIAIASAANSSGVWTLVSLVSLVLIWPSLAVSIKRWHDRGKSGWWVLIVLIPFIGWIWALIETGFLEGTRGPNQYGPDPLEAV